MHKWSSLGLIILWLLLSVQCQSKPKTDKATKELGKEKAMQLVSTAFDSGKMIPSKYTCDGENISPALQWDNVPAGTKSFALIADDPDAPMGTWVHWVIYNIPDSSRGLKENVPAAPKLPDGTLQGKNDFRKIGYGGPCPPGGVHRYYFKLYALDKILSVPAGLTKAELLKAMDGHILAKAELMGKYARKK